MESPRTGTQYIGFNRSWPPQLQLLESKSFTVHPESLEWRLSSFDAVYGSGAVASRIRMCDSGAMQVRSLDHIVLCVRDVVATRRFYERVLGMESREERPGKWSLHFGRNKISLQDAAASPDIARDTVPGSGNFCMLTDTPIAQVMTHLRNEGVGIVAGPGERAGAVGPILSVYVKDPDGNLVEVSNQL